MIASEPWEFVPAGRRAVEEHPGVCKQNVHLPTEHILLHRMQNVNISANSEERNEFWSMREIYETGNELESNAPTILTMSNDNKTPSPQAPAMTDREHYLCEYLVNSEEELYVKKQTAVWTRGIANETRALSRLCFTCETPIKFAFFCNQRFVCAQRKKKTEKVNNDESENEQKQNAPTSICLIDQNSLRVYCSSGEDFLANLEFPVSHVWQTKFGILLEKVASNAIIENHSISMPRLFSLAHPLDEISPVLHKSVTNVIGYLIESDYSIIYSNEHSDLLLLYDNKINKHFISRLRKATADEIQSVSTQNDLSMQQSIHRAGGAASTSYSQNSLKVPGGGATVKNSTAHCGRNSIGTTNFTFHISKLLSSDASISSSFGSLKNTTASPLNHLQSSIGQHSISMHDIRRVGQTQPSKPIVPQLCLQHIWTENTYGNKRDICEPSTRAFMHTDLLDDTYLCYLLPHSCRLLLVRLNNSDEQSMQIAATKPQCLTAKDALPLERMRMIAVLEPSGSLLLYTGNMLVSKVHVAPSLTLKTGMSAAKAAATVSFAACHAKSPAQTPTTTTAAATTTTFPRRSSLLPQKMQRALDSTFDEELHLLSPVSPLPPQFGLRQNVCLGLRDAVGNRLTLVYANSKMYRIALPLINETKFITRCLHALRYILKREQYLTLLIRWYSARNPPGSVDFSMAQEWNVFRQMLLELMGCCMVSSGGGGGGGVGANASASTADKDTHCAMSSWSAMSCGSGSGGDIHASHSFNAEEPKKRRKNDEITSGTDADWEFLLNVTQGPTSLTAAPTMDSTASCDSQEATVDTSACLFTAVPAIFYGLHLLYEDFKLDASMHDCLPHLVRFLHQMANDMQLSSYLMHYLLDFPHLLLSTNDTGTGNSGSSTNTPQPAQPVRKLFPLTTAHGAQMEQQHLLLAAAPCIYTQLQHIIHNRENVVLYDCAMEINELSRNVLQLVSLVLHGHRKIKTWLQPLAFRDSAMNAPQRPKRMIAINVPREQQLLQMLLNMQMTRDAIERLPVAVHLMIAECLERARLNPPIGSSLAAYELILRTELVEHARSTPTPTAAAAGTNPPAVANAPALQQPQRTHVTVEDALSARCPPSTTGIAHMETALDDGMDNMDTKLLSLRYDDMRIAEVRWLLSSSEPVAIDITQSPGITDHEFIEEQEKQLYALCTRTMTLPLGRGMFTLRTSLPTPTESMPIPKLCLSGREPLKGATIEMQQIEFPLNMSLWPTFHNGVAAGLKILPHARDVDSTWIVYNKPKGLTDISTEHAGFLMALGLNGHLKTLSFMSIYEYLVKCDEMTSVGLLLGISATHRGTMDNSTTKLLSVHIEALLPATALELDIPQSIQVAALMGIGLVFAGTAKRHIAEVLLQEVGRPPGPEMENSVERESYALTAGLALGLVTLGQGETPASLRDLQLPDTLHYYMVGGGKRPLTGAQKEKYKLPSFQVREGDMVNIDVTAPGATLGLGLMFFNTDNRAVAEWMAPPNTRYLLNLVRPDLLLLRTIARGLILWSDIQPTETWLFNQYPSNLQFDVERGGGLTATGPANISMDGSNLDFGGEVDHEAITQAYCNIIAGAGFCIGLKYAGTESPQAFKTLRRAIKMFLGFPGKYVGEYAGRTTIENCLMLLVIAISLVFAGSGDLEILRIIRYLRSRIGVQHPQVTYGSHMAIHMALGFLFLGAGRYTIAKTPEAVAALVCSLFPKFPNHSTDNRYHLQAFRHLYVLAVEPRLLLPRDIDTKKLCLSHVSVLEVGSAQLRSLPMAPCMLPELNTLQQVIIDDPNYWPVCFERGRNWQQLVKILENSSCIDIKKRLGCLSHIEDPDRLKSLLAQTLTTEQYLCWEIDAKAFERFSNESYVIGITDRYLQRATDEKDKINQNECAHKQMLTMLFYNAVIKDKMHVLSIYWTFYNILQRIRSTRLAFNDVWQYKLLTAYLEQRQRCGATALLYSVELMQAQVEQFKSCMEDALKELRIPLQRFLTAHEFSAHIVAGLTAEELSKLQAVIRYFVLTPNLLNSLQLSNGAGSDYLSLLITCSHHKLDILTIQALTILLQQFK